MLQLRQEKRINSGDQRSPEKNIYKPAKRRKYRGRLKISATSQVSFQIARSCYI